MSDAGLKADTQRYIILIKRFALYLYYLNVALALKELIFKK